MAQLSAVLSASLTAADYRAQRDTISTRRDQAAFAYRKVALTACREGEDALASVERLGEEETAVNAEREVYARNLKLASNRYRAGYSPYVDQLDAEHGLLSAELALVLARADQLNAAVRLYQALGGGGSTQMSSSSESSDVNARVSSARSDRV